MQRRAYLALCGGSLVGLAGCTGGEPAGGTPSPSPTRTPNPTPTRTPEARRPRISDVNLVTAWESFGDVIENEVESATPGAPIGIGYRYKIQSHDGEVKPFIQVEVYDEDDTRVAMEQKEDRQLTDGNDYSDWEGAMHFETRGWEKGEYTATVSIRDEISEKSASSRRGTFDLTEPLSESEVSFVEVDVPSRVQTGEPFTYEFFIRNVGNRDGTFRTKMSVRTEHWDWETSDEFWYVTAATGEVESWKSSEITIDEPGEYTYRLDAIDETWTVRVED